MAIYTIYVKRKVSKLSDFSIFSGRTTSSFPISIGTAMALETLFNPRTERYSEETPLQPRIDLSNYQTCYINLATIYRNLLASTKSEDSLRASVDEIYEAMLDEISIIKDLFKNEGENKTKPIFYNLSRLLERVFVRSKGVNTYEPKTELDKKYHANYNEIVKKFKEDKTIYMADSKISPSKPNSSLIITHIAYDLLSKKNFNRLDLLESHTGVLKSFDKWGTKFYKLGDKDLSIIPFNRKTVLMFGDRYFVTPSPIGLRRAVYETAVKRRWNGFTTMDKVNQDLFLDIKERYVLDFVSNL